MNEDELEALFAQALASTSRKVKVGRDPTPPRRDDAPSADEESIHIHIDESEELSQDIARLFGAPVAAKRRRAGDDDLVLPPLDDLDDGDRDATLPEADDILATLDGLDRPDPEAEDDDPFDELDRELQAALDDEDDEEDEDDGLQAAMERLLQDSYDDDVSVPEIPQHAGDEEILAFGDEGAMTLRDAQDAELEALRAQLGEMARTLTISDLEIRTLEDRVEGLEQQVVAATRHSANVGREFEAFRRRSDREKDDLKKFAAEKVLKEFLGVFDNLDRAIQHAGADRATPLAQGVQMILGQFMAALKRSGVEEVPGGVGAAFDPQWHEAVGQEFSETVPSGDIAGQMVNGFRLNGRLLRAAMVSVSRGPSPKAEPPLESESDSAEAEPNGAPAKPAKSDSKRRKSAEHGAKAADQDGDAESEHDDGSDGEDDTGQDGSSASGEDADEEEAPPPKKKRRRRKKAKTDDAEE